MLVKEVQDIVSELIRTISTQGKYGYNSFVYGLNPDKLKQVKSLININKMINQGLIYNYNQGFPLVQYQYPITSSIGTITRTEQITRKLNDVFKIKYTDDITPNTGDPYTVVSYIYKDAIYHDSDFLSTNIINNANIKNTL